MITIAVANQKGGVGKTTSTFHLARAAARRGLRTLVVDLDPQSNASSVLANPPLVDQQAGVADALSAHQDVELADVITTTVWDEVLLAPAGGEALAGVRDELTEALEQVADNFDLCLIDCAPALDQLTSNALAAADGVLIVTQPKLLSATGLAHLLDTMSTARRYLNPTLRTAGVLINLLEAGTTAGAAWQDELRNICAQYDLPLLEPAIPRRVVISDALEAQHGLDQYPGVPAELINLYDVHLATLLTTIEEGVRP